MLNIQPNCTKLTDFYNYMNFSDTDINDLNKEIRAKFQANIQTSECHLSWISRPDIDTLNIFRTEDINRALAHELVRKSNESAVIEYISKPECTGFIDTQSEYIYSERDALTSTDYIKMFTCYDQPKVSFYLYVSPFDPITWLLAVLNAALIWFIFHILIRSQQTITSYSPFLFILGTLIDEAYVVPKTFNRLSSFRILIIGWVLTSMLLSSCYQSLLVVELNSPLKGKPPSSAHQMVCPVTEDFESKMLKILNPKMIPNIQKDPTGIKNVYYLSNYWKEFGSISRYGRNHSRLQNDMLEQQHKLVRLGEAKNCFAFLLFPTAKKELLWSFGLKWRLLPSFFIQLQFREDPQQESLYLKAMLNRKFKLTSGFLSPLSRHFYLLDDFGADQMVSSRLWNYLAPRIEEPHLGFTALEWEITRNMKVAVVGAESRLANEIHYLKTQYRFIKQCTILPESLARTSQVWSFDRPYEHKLDQYFKSLVETGIYSIARENQKYRKTLKRLHGSRLVMNENETVLLNNRVQPVKLSGSIQTAFELWGLLIILGSGGFVVEICIRNGWLSKSLLVHIKYWLLSVFKISYKKLHATLKHLSLVLDHGFKEVIKLFRKLMKKVIE